ncbi:GNAT family N-acetyltransferase [Occultella gossypii]|nr:GNAT family N-acetyltransferase [Occultella gossypii]
MTDPDPTPAGESGGPGWSFDPRTLLPRIDDLPAFRAAHRDDEALQVLEDLWSGRPDRALPHAEMLLATNDTPRHRALVADVLRDLGRHDEAVARYQELVAQAGVGPRQAVMVQHLGKALFAAGRIGDAAGAFRRALELRQAAGADAELIASSQYALDRTSALLHRRDPSGATIRQADASDANSLARINRATFRETYGDRLGTAFWDRFTLDRAEEAWRTWHADGAVRWVALVAEEIVGFAFARASRPTGAHEPVRDVELYSLYVLAAHHGSGVGQRLLDHAVLPGTPAQLWVASDNPRALRFYERNGFRPDGVTDDGATFNGLPALRMVR